jgi:hypothetical protein
MIEDEGGRQHLLVRSVVENEGLMLEFECRQCKKYRSAEK